MTRFCLRDRTVIEVSGPDAATFLHNVTTQSFTAVVDGAAVFAALLTPQGKILADFTAQRRGEAFLLDVAASAAETLTRRFAFYKLRAKIAVTTREDLCVSRLCADENDAPDAFADPRLEGLGRALFAPASGAVQDDAPEWRRRRYAAGVPELGDFGGDEVFATDVNFDVLHAVDYGKGCFVGQEVTSRMKRKGEIRKRTFTAVFSDPAPAPGTSILAGEKTIGELLSVEGEIGLTLVRLDRLNEAKDAALTAGGQTLRLDIPSFLKPR